MFSEKILPFSSFITFTFPIFMVELFCFLHREEFDEEKEPDGMLLSGWTQPVSTSEKEKEDKSINNGASSSVITTEAEKDETGVEVAAKKRRISEISEVAASAVDKTNHKQYQVIDDEDDLVMLDGNSDNNKRKRLQ